jgi:hypothetical protein
MVGESRVMHKDHEAALTMAPRITRDQARNVSNVAAGN